MPNSALRVKITIPKIDATEEEIDESFKKVARKLAWRVHRTYDELTSDWRKDGARDIDVPVVFNPKITKKAKGILVEVKTESLKYRYVDLGTKSHTITPRPDNKLGLLIFPSEYKPKTSVKSLNKVEGGKDMSSPWLFVKRVEHPGNEGRDFESPIIDEQKPKVIKDLKDSLDNIIKIETETYVS